MKTHVIIMFLSCYVNVMQGAELKPKALTRALPYDLFNALVKPKILRRFHDKDRSLETELLSKKFIPSDTNSLQVFSNTQSINTHIATFNQHGLEREKLGNSFTIEEDGKLPVTVKTKFAQDTSSTQLDGPNADGIIVIAQNSVRTKRDGQHIIYYLMNLPAQRLRACRAVTSVDYQGVVLLPDHRLKTMALANQGKFALVSRPNVPWPVNETLSVYNYKVGVMLSARSELKGSLKKISFVGNTIMLGVTGDRRLVSLWPQGSSVKYVLHRTGFPVDNIYVDTAHPQMIILETTQDIASTKIRRLLSADLTTIDQNKIKCLPIVLPPEINPSAVITYHDHVIRCINDCKIERDDNQTCTKWLMMSKYLLLQKLRASHLPQIKKALCGN